MIALDADRLRSDLGSFWYENVDDVSQEKLRTVIRAATTGTTHQKLLHIRRRLSDEGGHTQIEGETIVASWTPVLFHGEKWYSIGKVLDFEPLVIEGGGMQYVFGIDFVLHSASGQIIFPEQPEGDEFVVIRGKRDNPGVMLNSFLYGMRTTPFSGEAETVASYVRGNHTIQDFRNALRAIAGLVRLQKGGLLVSRYDRVDGTVYVFEDERIEVFYNHQLLEPGNRYDKDTWIGSELLEVWVNDGSKEWWRKSDWSEDGLSIGKLTGVSGLKVDDRESVVTNDSGTIRFPLSSPVTSSENTFWNRVSDKQSELGVTVADKYPTGTQVNPLDVFFEDFLDHAVIIRVDANVMRPQSVYEIFNWADDNIPFGYVPIYRVIDGFEVEKNPDSWNPEIRQSKTTGPLYQTGGFLFYNDSFLYYGIDSLALE